MVAAQSRGPWSGRHQGGRGRRRTSRRRSGRPARGLRTATARPRPAVRRPSARRDRLRSAPASVCHRARGPPSPAASASSTAPIPRPGPASYGGPGAPRELLDDILGRRCLGAGTQESGARRPILPTLCMSVMRATRFLAPVEEVPRPSAGSPASSCQPGQPVVSRRR